jgi:hypothetical protein
MQARIRPSTIFSIACVAVVACGRTSTGGRLDGAAPSSGDTAKPNDVMLPKDASDDLASDLPGSDMVVRSDSVVADSASRDLVLPDEAGDGSGDRDVSVPADLAVRDVGPRDIASGETGGGDLAIRDATATDLLRDSVGREPEVASDGMGADLGLDIASEVGAADSAIDRGAMPVDGAMADFCSGDSPKMVVNGSASTPTVTGRIIPYNCCDGGEFVAIDQVFGHTIFVDWRAQVGPSATLPATIDLANPAQGWGVGVFVGCDVSTTRCYPAPDSYDMGFEGLLQVSRGTGGYDMSVCLHLVEPAGSAHPLLHSLDFYAPHVSSH